VRNNEEQYYTDRPENAFIEGGKLVIRAIPEAHRGGNYTSASLITEDNAYWVYGCIEARIKVPDAPGCWPAFWLLPQDKVYGNTPPYDSWWPANGEVDIMESVSQTPDKVFGTAHFLHGDQHHYDVSWHALAEPLAGDYHVFGIQWSETSIEWYVDDIHYHSFDISQPIDGRRPFAETFYIILNLAVGGKWPEDPDPAQYPEEMLVDWVRVWQFL
jgi:beta-glucanase (GH16 family)